MKRLLLPLCFSGLLFTGILNAQLNSQIPTFSVAPPDYAGLMVEDQEREKQGMFYRIGVDVPVDLNIYEQGEWWNDGNGNLVYQIKISAAAANGINVSFDEFTLPEKSELRLYNPDTKMVVGPYTAEHSSEDGLMTLSTVKGDYAILEVVIPENAQGELKLHITNVGYFYRALDFSATVDDEIDTRALGDSDGCEVNVNCSPEGTSWQDEKRGVARVQVKEGSSYGYCSGSLINNTANDCTPYFLLAQHCGSAASASDFRQWIFYFNYEGAGCSDPGSEPSTSNVTGSVRVSSSGTISNVQKSDFLLLILKGRPVSGANAYYNGWNRNNTGSSSGVGIHHPAGDIKKISTYTTTLTSATWSGGTSNAHWRVIWAGTANGHGVTEGGSSGSPIFNSSGLIVGDLSGGSSYCTPASSLDDPDLYGKFSYSWNSCGSTNQLKLEPWLDRSATSATTLTGIENSSCAAGTLPTVDCNATNQYPIIGEIITLNDITTNSPFYWQYVITGPGTVTYQGGTTLYSQNPQVSFSANGNYTIVMYAANTAGYAYKTKSSYIHVGVTAGIEDEEENPIVFYPNPVNDVLYINLGNNIWNIDNTTITIMDLTGKYVLAERISTSNANTLSVNIPESINTGFYIVQITDGKNTKTEKLEIIK